MQSVGNSAVVPYLKQVCQQIRSYGKHNKKFLYKDGVKYGQLFYYPRTENHVDPPVEPAKLFRVERIKPYKGCPYWEKRILRDLGLGEDIRPKREIAIVKNIPENNARLWKIKHLIKITPINFPFGEPTANDTSYTHLKSNGDCIVIKELKVDEKCIEGTQQMKENPKRLDGSTLNRDSRLKWLNAWQTS